MDIVRYDEKCIVKQDNSNKQVEAVVYNFQEKKSLTVVINQTVKLPMVWNGTEYEGRMAGIDFTSAGPKVSSSSNTVPQYNRKKTK